ncbi:MAG: HPr-rel-A system PqqD family peptide chaperone [Rubrivivax sp.]|nr:HPr-rel-A system PqqD family peptide chaperone [Rubrivivax sp.]
MVTPAWQLSQSAALQWRRWDEQVVVYDPAATATHLLTDGPAEIFGLLVDAGDTTVSEADLLAACGATDATDTEIAALRDILDSLRTLGLTECRAL